MELDELQRNWDEFGKQDPLWAIRSEPDKRGGKWDLAEFFGSGEEHVRELVDRLTELGLPTHGVVLDFGCGVGRLTQAFADHFDEVWGIDIAPSMIEGAEAFNRHGSRVALRRQRHVGPRSLRRRVVRSRLLGHRAAAHPSGHLARATSGSSSASASPAAPSSSRSRRT